MKTSAFLGLPSHAQELVFEGLDSEVQATRQHIREVEQATPHDPELLAALRNDITYVESLRSRLTGGQA